MKLKPKAIRLLERVKRHILEEPKRANIRVWAKRLDVDQGGPACRTVGCIAGWTVLLSVPKTRWRYYKSQRHGLEIQIKATRLLGISMRQVSHLFSPDGIPAVAGTPEHAEAVAQRISRFIQRHR